MLLDIECLAEALGLDSGPGASRDRLCRFDTASETGGAPRLRLYGVSLEGTNESLLSGGVSPS
jgi:hypothetical protein